MASESDIIRVEINVEELRAFLDSQYEAGNMSEEEMWDLSSADRALDAIRSLFSAYASPKLNAEFAKLHELICVLAEEPDDV